MADLRDLFKLREDTYDAMTAEIIKSLPNVFKGCIRFIVSNGADEKLLNWDSVKMVEEHNLVLLNGSLTYKPGDVVKLPDGEEVEVNENTADYFKAVLHIALPYALAVEGSDEEVYDFLIDTMDMSEAEAVLVDDGDDNEHQNEKEDESFNVEDLTDEQRRNLAMYLATNNAEVKKN